MKPSANNKSTRHKTRKTPAPPASVRTNQKSITKRVTEKKLIPKVAAKVALDRATSKAPAELDEVLLSAVSRRPLAPVVYPFTGWLLSPMIAAVAMSLSSASVISSTLRLSRR